MKSFIEKVQSVTKSMDEAPYDDEKTREAASEATKKVIQWYEEIKKSDYSK